MRVMCECVRSVVRGGEFESAESLQVQQSKVSQAGGETSILLALPVAVFVMVFVEFCP